MLLKIDIDDDGGILKEQIVLKEKIGRIRDVDVNSKGEVFLISDEPKSYLWKLTKN
jgi:quinoprotein glucose dehydrogenase